MEQSPYSAPKSKLVDSSSDSSERIYGYKKLVIQHKDDGAKWPNRCYQCNAETDNKKELKLYYMNPWIFLTILISPLILIVISLIVRKKFLVSLPICDQHIKKRRKVIAIHWLMVVIMLLVGMVGIVQEVPLLIVLACLLLLGVIITAIIYRLAVITKFKDDQIWIKGAKQQFIHSLAEFHPK